MVDIPDLLMEAKKGFSATKDTPTGDLQLSLHSDANHEPLNRKIELSQYHTGTEFDIWVSPPSVGVLSNMISALSISFSSKGPTNYVLPSLPEQGQFLDSIPSYPGYPDKTQFLYIREAVTNLWTSLNPFYNEMRRVIVQGPPGMGKTLSIWGFSLHYSIKQKETVLFLRIPKKETPSYAFIENETIKAFELSGAEQSLYSLLSSLCNQNKPSLLVLDGVTQDSFNYVLKELQKDYLLGVSVIICMSMQIAKSGEIMDKTKLNPSLLFPCWNYNDLLTVWNRGGEEVLNNEGESFEDRFYYSGSSVRYLFLKKEILLEDLNSHLNLSGVIF